MHGWIAHIDNEPVGHIHMLLEANNKLNWHYEVSKGEGYITLK